MCSSASVSCLILGDITPIRFRATYDQTKDIKLAQAAAGHTTSVITFRYYVKGQETFSKAAAVVGRAYSA